MTFGWTQASGPPVTIDAADQALAAVAPIVAGTYEFDLAVTAGTATSEWARMRVFVSERAGQQAPVPRPKLLSPVSSVTGEDRVRIPSGGTLTVQLEASQSFSPGGAALGYRWRQVGGPTVVPSSDRAAQPSFSPLVSRVYSFELTASDGRLESASSIDIVVDSPFNSVPRASVATPPAARAGSSVTLDGSRSADPDGNSLLYRWVQTAGLPVTAANSRTARLSFTPPAAGVYKFRLFVDDGRDRSTPKEVTVTAADASGGGTTNRSTTGATGGGGSCALGKAGGGNLAPLLYGALLLWFLVRRRGGGA